MSNLSPRFGHPSRVSPARGAGKHGAGAWIDGLALGWHLYQATPEAHRHAATGRGAWRRDVLYRVVLHTLIWLTIFMVAAVGGYFG